MSYYGNIKLGSTIDVKFTTRKFSTGAPFTLAGSPVISAYVDNGTTELTAGITLTVDFDSRTGLNNVRVVATSGNGYAAGTNVQLVITTGTVDSVSVVGEVVGEFAIQNRDVSHFGGYDLYADGPIPLLGIIDKGTAQSASATGLVLRAAAAFDNNSLVGANAVVLGSTQGFYQTREVTASALSGDTTTNDTWTTTPSGTVTYILFAGPPAPTTLPTVNATQLAGQTITAAAGVTFPSSVASPTNITAGTISTVTNLTNAPTAGDLTATMKTSVQTAADAALVANSLDKLLKSSATAGDVTNSSIIARLASKSATPSFASFVNTTDSLEALRDNMGSPQGGDAYGVVTDGVFGNLALKNLIVALNNLSAAQVNAEVLDVLGTDTIPEIAADPGATPTALKALMLLYMALRNKVDVDATTKEVHNNAGTVVLTKTLSDNGVIYSESKMA